MFRYLFTYLFICLLPIYLFIYLIPVYLHIYLLPVYLVTYLLLIYLFTYLYIYLHLTAIPFSRVGGLLYDRQGQNHAVGL